MARFEWQREFRSSFKVPVSFSIHSKLHDCSWHNDVCPSFQLLGREDTRLWVDHPSRRQRETDQPHRFNIYDHSDDGPEEALLSTDSIGEVLRWLDWYCPTCGQPGHTPETCAWSVPALTARIKREILADIEKGTLPKTIDNFGDVHDYVDGNCYGGLCEDSCPLRPSCDEHSAIIDQAQKLVDAWLLAGRPPLEVVCHVRARLPRRGGNSFYRDHSDLSRHARTLCGAAVTSHDYAWQTRKIVSWRRDDGVQFTACPECVRRREGRA